jgi:hypothetical protein
MGLDDLMDATGNPSGDLGDTDRFRLLRHGQPPNSAALPRLFSDPAKLKFFFRTCQSIFRSRRELGSALNYLEAAAILTNPVYNDRKERYSISIK